MKEEDCIDKSKLIKAIENNVSDKFDKKYLLKELGL